jgi:hypothetical protein
MQSKNSVPCTQPPYGMISAVDLRTRRLLWSKPFGTAAGSGPFGLASHLPISMGVPNIVKIHPFRNGNGRHSRLLADLLLDKHFRVAPFTWGGSAGLGNTDPNRQAYLHGLKAADKGDYASLLRLCRAS